MLNLRIVCAISGQVFVWSVMPGNLGQKPTSRICNVYKTRFSAEPATFEGARPLASGICLSDYLIYMGALRNFQAEACITQNPANTSVLSTEQGEVRNGRYKRLNLLKPAGYVMHQQFNIQQLYVLPTLYLYVLYLPENKQRLVPLTA